MKPYVLFKFEPPIQCSTCKRWLVVGDWPWCPHSRDAHASSAQHPLVEEFDIDRIAACLSGKNATGRCSSCGRVLTVGDWPFCPHAAVEPRTASVHASERAQILVNPQTGETRIEGRTDRPIHPKYRAAGFTERRDLSTLADVRAFEKKTGYIHEQTNYDNSGRQERDTGSV